VWAYQQRVRLRGGDRVGQREERAPAPGVGRADDGATPNATCPPHQARAANLHLLVGHGSPPRYPPLSGPLPMRH
jgi:hypothetical protein